MSGTRVFGAPIGGYETNCYLIRDEASGEAAAVDCAVFDADYRRLLAEAGIGRLKYILLTHGHFDHICGVKDLRDACGGEVCISAADAPALTDEAVSLNATVRFARQTPCPPDRLLAEGDALMLGETPIRVLETPGHTPGGLCFIAGNALFCGDTLFRLSMGRTDLPGGSTLRLFASLHRLGALDADLIVYPGHGAQSTLDFERRNNYYLHAGTYGQAADR